MSARVWMDPNELATFYIHPTGFSDAGPPRWSPPEGWRYRVVMHDHTGDALDALTGEEWTVRPADGWWSDHERIADAVIEVAA